MRLLRILLINVILVCGSTVYAVDPPRLLDYKHKVLSGLEDSYTRIELMYDQRFVTLVTSPTATINKSPVYYDAVKVLREFYELCHDRTGLSESEIATLDKIPGIIEKAKKILATRFAAVGGGGYTAFPHGLAYEYSEDGDTESYSGLKGLMQIGNFVTSYNPDREHINYVRDDIYSLQVALTSKKYNIPVLTGKPSHDAIMSYYKGMALSHLTQWDTGNFYYVLAASPADYRSSFMTGLCIMGLAEYYDRIEKDSSILPAAKKVLDGLWALNWHADVTNPYPTTLGDTSSYISMSPGGGFWTWANYIAGTGYVIDRNHNPSSIDVGPNHNLIIGPAYAWYAVVSGDELYMNRAVDIFNGAAANLQLYNPEGQLWEGMRYAHEFIRYYRKFYNTPCGSDAIEQCSTSGDCTSAGGSWTGEYCRWQPVSVLTTSGLSGAPIETTTCYQDSDNDLYGTGVSEEVTGSCSSGYYLISHFAPGLTGDCNDSSSSIYPGATEICGDGIDQDCNGYDLVCPTADPVIINGLLSPSLNPISR